MKIGIVSDIHEDVISLTRALQIMEKERCDQVVSLGDIVGFDNGYYGAARVQDAEECIRLLKENCSLSIAGNHDLFAIKKLPEYKSRFDYPSHWYSIPLGERQRMGKGKIWDYSHAEDQIQLSDVSRSYLSRLPEFAILEYHGIRILFSHHLYPDLSGSLRKMPSWAPNIWPHLKWMKRQGSHIGISGHIHIEGTLSGTWFHLHSSLNNQFSLNGRRTWITCPPLTQGGVSSGLMIIDLESGLVSTIRIDTLIPS